MKLIIPNEKNTIVKIKTSEIKLLLLFNKLFTNGELLKNKIVVII